MEDKTINKEKAYEEIKNMSFLLIPIEFDFDALELTTDEAKQNFIDRFLKDVVDVPLTEIELNEWDEPQEKVCGIINRAEQKDNFRVDLYAYSWNLTSVNYNREPTTEENAKQPLGEKLTVSSISLEKVNKVNESYYAILKKKKELTERINKRIKQESDLMEKMKKKEEENSNA